jgi:hypothetical protein
MTTGETPHTSLATVVNKKPQSGIKYRLGLGGISQAAIDRVHELVNMKRAEQGKVPIDFSVPANKPRFWRKRSVKNLERRS